MSKKKIALIFFAGAIFGIVSFIGIIVLWVRISGWWPYQRPDAATVAKIERIAGEREISQADTNPPFLMKKVRLPLNEYRRWYVQGKDNGRDVIWGEWDQGGKPGLYLGHRALPPDYNMVLGGGCGWVHLRYDLARQELDTFWCNAPL